MAIFKNRLKELRQSKKMTLEELANEIGTTKSTISRYENGMRQPKQDILEAIADFFNVSTDYLLGRTNTKTIFSEPIIPYKVEQKLTKKDINFLKKLIKDFIEHLD